jgi:hypothetical protein
MAGGHDTATLKAFSGRTSGSAAIGPFLPIDSPPRILAVERQTRHCRYRLMPPVGHAFEIDLKDPARKSWS